MVLRGRIDRIDIAPGDGQRQLLRVIDYKSSPRGLDLNKAMFGLALQLGLYLLVAAQGERALPAGLLYVAVRDPIVDAHPRVTPDEAARDRLRALRANGWMLGDMDVVRAMDKRATGELVPVRLKSDGTPDARSRVLTPRQMDRFLGRLRRKAGELGTAIFDGAADIAPYRLANEIPCTWCAFKAFCQFDEEVPGFGYRQIQPRPAKDILSELDAGDDEDRPGPGPSQAHEEGNLP